MVDGKPLLFFDLLLIGLVLATMGTLVAVLIQLIRRRLKAAARTALAIGIIWIGYLGFVAVVSARTPQHIVARGDELSSDEMCFAVNGLATTPELGPPSHTVKAHGVFYVVRIKVSNHSRGRPESETGVRARLWDGTTYYDESAEGLRAYRETHGPSAPLTVRLASGVSAISVHVFDLLPSVALQGLVIDKGFNPAFLVIGESPLFHAPTVMRLTKS